MILRWVFHIIASCGFTTWWLILLTVGIETLPSTTSSGVPAAYSNLSNPAAAIVGGGMTNAFDEILKATPPALVAFLASLPVVEGNFQTLIPVLCNIINAKTIIHIFSYCSNFELSVRTPNLIAQTRGKCVVPSVGMMEQFPLLPVCFVYGLSLLRYGERSNNFVEDTFFSRWKSSIWIVQHNTFDASFNVLCYANIQHQILLTWLFIIFLVKCGKSVMCLRWLWQPYIRSKNCGIPNGRIEHSAG